MREKCFIGPMEGGEERFVFGVLQPLRPTVRLGLALTLNAKAMLI